MMTDLDFKAKLATLQFNGSPRRPLVKVDRDANLKYVETINDANGTTSGFETFHQSGRKDADAFVDPCVILPKNES
jgi:hypothetical protein